MRIYLHILLATILIAALAKKTPVEAITNVNPDLVRHPYVVLVVADSATRTACKRGTGILLSPWGGINCRSVTDGAVACRIGLRSVIQQCTLPALSLRRSSSEQSKAHPTKHPNYENGAIPWGLPGWLGL